MKFFFGLGNPGEKYQFTRHNVGFMAADVLQQRIHPHSEYKHKAKFQSDLEQFQEFLIIKPQTFMNSSGQAVRSVLEYFAKDSWRNNLDQVYVLHDDLDIVLGEHKLSFGKGPKVHNGLLSIYEHLGTDQFWHVRIGVDNRGGVRSQTGAEYVLGQFTREERLLLDPVLSQIADNLLD